MEDPTLIRINSVEKSRLEGWLFFVLERLILVVMKRINHRVIILSSSIVIFLISLTQQCYCTTNSCGYSIAAVFSGAIGLLLGGAGISWLANPLLLISWISINKKPKLSLITGFLAVIISFSFLFFSKIRSDEAGNYSQIISYELGYWLWVLSSLIMFAGNIWLYFIKAKAAAQPDLH
ncbi:hypothetical protein [Mucilaginibacter sp. NFX135]|uniref:hypothetical protein n=1 Tax=Mucilaginibacter sp. NFX135 TaxID=3402687 RepID=UPI003AFB365A